MSRVSRRRFLLSTAGTLGTITVALSGAHSASKQLRGKELVVAVGSFGEDLLDPVGMTSSPMRGYLEPMYDSFIRVDNEGKLIPGVFTSWKVSGDRKYWQCEVRKGVKFHGNWGEATAEDVKFSIERFMGDDSSYKGPARNIIKEVTIEGSHTVRIHTPKPDPTLPIVLSQFSVSPHFFLMSKKYITEKGVEAFRKSPIASGPYQFKNHVAGSSIEYTAFDDHWGTRPGYDSLKVLLVPQETARVGLLRQGRVQIIEVTPDGSKDVKAAGLDVRSSPGAVQIVTQIYGVYHNEWKGQPTADVRVRKALSLLINRQEVIDALLPQGEFPTALGVMPANQNVDYKAWIPKAREAYKYDPQAARKLLTEAGYPNGFAISLLTFEMSGAPLPTVGQAVAGYWEKAGIKVRLIPTDFGAFRALRDAEPQAPTLLGQASMHRYVSTPDDLLNQRVPFYGNKGVFRLLNSAPHKSAFPTIEANLNAVAAEFDTRRREELFAKIIAEAMETYVSFPIAQVPILFGVDPKIDLDVRPLTQIGARVVNARPKG